MSWRKLTDIKGVHTSPRFVKNQLLYFDGESNLHSHNIGNYEKLVSKPFEKNYSLNVISDEIFVYLEDSILTLNETILEEDQIWLSKFGRPAILNQNHFYEQLYDRKVKSMQVGVYDRNNGTEIWKKVYEGHRFVRNFSSQLFITDINFKYLIKIDLKTGQEIWRYDLPSGEKVGGKIVLYENILIIPTSNNHLYALNVENGNNLWELPGYFRHYSLDAKRGLLYGYAREYYQVIDPKEGKILIDKKFDGSEEKYRISPQGHMHTLSEDGLYFMSNWYEPRFGKININNHEIEFVQELEVEEGVKGDIPVYHNGHLYIKDSMNTLHIFEKE